uniref:Putative secreted protein n=1 Tax=Anopheles darlingi TaxID=43151 RepID=A0A2M4DBV1_ANODA
MRAVRSLVLTSAHCLARPQPISSGVKPAWSIHWPGNTGKHTDATDTQSTLLLIASCPDLGMWNVDVRSPLTNSKAAPGDSSATHTGTPRGGIR